MKLKVGDWVRVATNGDQDPPRRIVAIYDDPSFSTIYDAGDGLGFDHSDDELTPLTVSDAFTHAGFPVPEGAKLCYYNGDQDFYCGWAAETPGKGYGFYGIAPSISGLRSTRKGHDMRFPISPVSP